jgi:phosphatidylglycerophosphatase C
VRPTTGAPPTAPRAVAVFDLDGTLTHHDTLVPYLAASLAAHPARAWRLAVVPGALARFAFDRDRGRLKSRLIRALLGGCSRVAVDALTERFLDEHWSRLFRREALAALERHRAAGDYLVLLSASTDCYVTAIGARLGVDEVICTELQWDGDRLDGALVTPNRRGAEKSRCLARLRDQHPGARFAAYGNSRSDLDHLSQVESGVLVNGSTTARRAARAIGLPTSRWA